MPRNVSHASPGGPRTSGASGGPISTLSCRRLEKYLGWARPLSESNAMPHEDRPENLEQGSSEPQSVSRPEPLRADTFLQDLVAGANAPRGWSYPVTLNVRGLIVTGELVGIAEYFENFGAEVEEGLEFPGMSPDDARTSAKLIGDMFRRFAREARKAHEKDPQHQPNFIHLRNASIFTPGGGVVGGNHSSWWRGKVEAVDGFMLGTAEPTSEAGG